MTWHQMKSLSLISENAVIIDESAIFIDEIKSIFILHPLIFIVHTLTSIVKVQSSRFQVQSHSLYLILYTILVASLYNIRYHLILYSIRPNRVNSVRQPSKHRSPTELIVSLHPKTYSLNLHSQPSPRDNKLTIIRLL